MHCQSEHFNVCPSHPRHNISPMSLLRRLLLTVFHTKSLEMLACTYQNEA